MKKRREITIVCLLLMIALAAGCGVVMGAQDGYENSVSKSSYDTGDLYQVKPTASSSATGSSDQMAVVEETAAVEAPEAEMADAGRASGSALLEGESTAAETGRKLIKTVYIYSETEYFDSLTATIEARTKELGGYLESIVVYNNGGKETKSANLTIRIPEERLADFVREVSENSNILSREENSQDITLQYVDLESKKAVLLAEQKKLLEFMEKAETIEDVIALEARLSEVRYELESMEAQLRVFDNKVNYATINLNIGEVQQLTPQNDATIFDQMRVGFMKSVGQLINGLQNLIIWFVSVLPFLFLLFLIGLMIFLPIRAKVKRNKKKKEAFRQEASISESSVTAEDEKRKEQ